MGLKKYSLMILLTIILAGILSLSLEAMEVFERSLTESLTEGLAGELGEAGAADIARLTETVQEGLAPIAEELAKVSELFPSLGESLGKSLVEDLQTLSPQEALMTVKENLITALSDLNAPESIIKSIDSTELAFERANVKAFEDIQKQITLPEEQRVQLTGITEEPLPVRLEAVSVQADVVSGAELEKFKASRELEGIEEGEPGYDEAKSRLEKAEKSYTDVSDAYKENLDKLSTEDRGVVEKQRLRDQEAQAREGVETARKELNDLQESAKQGKPVTPEELKKAEAALNTAKETLDYASNRVSESQYFSEKISPSNIKRLFANEWAKFDATETLLAVGTEKLKWAGDHLLGLGEQFLSGFVFLFSGWIVDAITTRLQGQANYATIAAPQYIGNIWMQIPLELLDKDNPMASIPLYGALPNPTDKQINEMKKGNRVIEYPNNQYAAADFFVTVGNYGAYAENPITTSSTGQLLHLNTGLQFYGDGSPVNRLQPALSLVGGTKENPGVMAILQKLEGLVSAGKVTKTYNMYENGGLTETSKTPVSQRIASLFRPVSTSAEASAPVLGKTLTALRDTPYKYGTSGIRIQGINGLSDSAMKQLTKDNSAVGVPDPSIVYGAYNIFIYQTKDTPLARDIAANIDPEAQKLVYDYVVPVTAYNQIVPALIPAAYSTGDNAKSQTYIPRYILNPDVAYLISLLDNSAISVKNGAKKSLDSTKKILEDARAEWKKYPIFAPLEGQINTVTSLFNQKRAHGPFTVGNFVLEVPKLLGGDASAQGIFVYSCKQNTHGGDGTLEGSQTQEFVDYLVPLDQSRNPVALPDTSGSIAYFVSLVSSRLYTNDMVLVEKSMSFDLVELYNKAFALPDNSLELWQAQEIWKAGNGDVIKTAQTTPEGSFYTEWEFNPFNGQPALFMLSAEIQQIIEQSPVSLFASLRTNGQLPHGFAAAAAYWLMEGLQAAGITDTLLAGSDVAALAQLLTSRLEQAVNQTPNLTSAMSPTALINGLKAKTDLFEGLADSLGQALKDHPETTSRLAMLPEALRKLDVPAKGQSLSTQLAHQNKIPFDSLFIYNPVLVNLPNSPIMMSSWQNWDRASGKAGISAKEFLDQHAPAISKAIQNAHEKWYTYRMGNQASWIAFEAMGPFNFTNLPIANVVIQATSVSDIQKGSYVYTSPNYPGQYFVVASTNPTKLPITKSERFHPLTPADFLVSLTTGDLYQRTTEGEITLLSEKIESFEELLSTFEPQLQQAITTSREHYQPERSSFISFGQFVLYLAPEDETHKAYIYQDVSGLVNARSLSSKEILVNAADLFVAAHKGDSLMPTDIGQPITGSTDIVISLLTGDIYDRNGYISPLGDLQTQKPGAAANQLLEAVKNRGAVVRSDIEDSLKKMVEEAQAGFLEEQKEIASQQALEPHKMDSNELANIQAADCLAVPYDHIVFANGKYYGVAFDAESKPGVNPGESSRPAVCANVPRVTIFDYSVRPDQGILYDGKGNPIARYEQWLLQSARQTAGIILEGEGQRLGMPNTHPVLPTRDKDGSTMVAVPLEEKQLKDGSSYTFWFNKHPQVRSYFAKVKSSEGSAKGSEYYLDLQRGYHFTLDGLPTLMRYDVLEGEFGDLLFIYTDGAAVQHVHYALGDYYRDYRNKGTISTPQGQASQLESGFPDDTLLLYKTVDKSGVDAYNIAAQMSTATDTGQASFEDPDQRGSYMANGQTFELLTYIGTGKDQAEFKGAQTPYVFDDAHPALIVRSAQGDVINVLFKTAGGKGLVQELLFTAKKTGTVENSKDTENISVTYTLTATNPVTQTADTLILKDNLVDPGTAARYASIAFTGPATSSSVYFFGYTYQSLSPAELKKSLQELRFYVVADAQGVQQLVQPFNPNSLESIERVIDAPSISGEPTDSSPAHRKLLESTSKIVQQSDSFAYSKVINRYVYHITDADRARNVAFARPLPASYIDLETGILFDGIGTPSGQAILASDLYILLDTYNIAAPGFKGAEKGEASARSRIPDEQGSYLYLVYRGGGVTSPT